MMLWGSTECSKSQNAVTSTIPIYSRQMYPFRALLHKAGLANAALIANPPKVSSTCS
jgi:hypothetical protein